MFYLKSGGPPSKSKNILMTDSEQYREGKVKRICESEKNLKFNANNLPTLN